MDFYLNLFFLIFMEQYQMDNTLENPTEETYC